MKRLIVAVVGFLVLTACGGSPPYKCTMNDPVQSESGEYSFSVNHESRSGVQPEVFYRYDGGAPTQDNTRRFASPGNHTAEAYAFFRHSNDGGEAVYCGTVELEVE